MPAVTGVAVLLMTTAPKRLDPAFAQLRHAKHSQAAASENKTD
jgi:hypothetical protein